MLTAMTAAALTLAALTPTPAAAPSGKVTIDVVTVNGSGCPTGTTAVAAAAGAHGVERANYYFQGESQNTPRTHTFNGPMSDNWQATDKVEVAAIVYHPCGERRNFNINTELRVSAGSSDPKTTTSFMTMDSTDGSINTTYHFAWKQCT